MDKMFIEPAPNSPLFYFEPNGRLLIEGRAIPEDVSYLFEPALLFIKKLESEQVTFEFNLEYFNTAASKKILEMLKAVEANSKVKSCTVNWHYETDDDDSLDMVEIYKDSMKNMSFNIIEHEDYIPIYDQFQSDNS
jgi:hypothetical protein